MTSTTLYLPVITAGLARTTYAEPIEEQARKLGISLDQHILEALVNPAKLAGASGGKDSASDLTLVESFGVDNASIRSKYELYTSQEEVEPGKLFAKAARH